MAKEPLDLDAPSKRALGYSTVQPLCGCGARGERSLPSNASRPDGLLERMGCFFGAQLQTRIPNCVARQIWPAGQPALVAHRMPTGAPGRTGGPVVRHVAGAPVGGRLNPPQHISPPGQVISPPPRTATPAHAPP